MDKKIYYEMPPKKKGFHRHHIKPKHMGGTDADGIIYVTKVEHAEAHWRLYCEHKKEVDLLACNLIMEQHLYSVDQRGEKNPMYGRHLTEEQKEVKRQWMLNDWATRRKGWKQSEKSKQHLSKIMKEKYANGYVSPSTGIPMGEEAKEKLRIKATGRKHSEETKKLMSKQRSGPNGQNVKSGITFAPIEEQRKHNAALGKKRRNASDTTREAYNKYMREYNAKQKQKNQGQGTLEVLFE